MAYEFERKQTIAVLGGGPGGYEAALAGAQLGADVTLVERTGVGGSAVITDVVPSKSLIATAEATNAIGEAADLGVQFFTRGESGKPVRPQVAVNLAAVNKRLMGLARQQSEDMRAELVRAGVRIVTGEGRLDGPSAVIVSTAQGRHRHRLRPDRGRHHRRLGRRQPAHPAVGGAGRRAHPDLDAALRARPRPGAPHRGRLRRDRGRVRLRLHGPRLEGHPHLQPRPGAAGRGRRRRPRHRERVQAQRDAGALEVARRIRSCATERRRARDPLRRSHRRGLATA